MEGRKQRGRGGRKEERDRVGGKGRGRRSSSHWVFMNVQALAQKWPLSVGGK